MSKKVNKPYNLRLRIHDTDIVVRAENLKKIIDIMTFKDHESIFFGNVLLFNCIDGIISYVNCTQRQISIIKNLVNTKLNLNKL